jgi:hypothetical protein
MSEFNQEKSIIIDKDESFGGGFFKKISESQGSKVEKSPISEIEIKIP